MKLNGWTWLISGIIVAMVSGYVYLFIPKNGSPNVAMALFFFIGIIFIVVGLLKILFTHKEDKIIMNAIVAPERKNITQIQAVQSRPNKIEQQINQMMTQAQNNNNNNQTTTNINNANHTNSFYNKYQYTGPVHQTHTTHSNHPANNAQTHTATHQPSHHIPNAEHGLKCRSCGNANSGHANYCHQCGHRLK
jgi:hypothetical protein